MLHGIIQLSSDMTLVATLRQLTRNVPTYHSILRSYFVTIFSCYIFSSHATAFAFSSGTAATQVVCQTLKAGDHIVTMDDLYGGTTCLFQKISANLGITATFVDLTNLDNLKNAIQPNTRVWNIW